MSNRAWVTLATNDSYGLGALVLAHSLRRAGSAYPAVVLITPSVTEAMRDRLHAVFAEVVTVDVLDSGDAAHLALLQRPELGITFTKIHCWNLTQYEKCVFLDADALVVQNCDELFEREELSAAPDVGWPDCFNSGVFVYTPSADTFNKLIQFAQERGSFDGGDQGLLNSFFSDWAHGDINRHLPFLYNVTSAAFYSYVPALKHYGQNLKIIHFIGAAKPWLQHFNWDSRAVDAPEHLRQFLQLWWDLFVADVHAQLDISMVEVEAPHHETTIEHPPVLPPQDVNQHFHYQPILDPESEFPWHRPDAQIQKETQEQQIDMSEIFDPWDIYGGHIPPKPDDVTGHRSEGKTEEHADLRKYVWEYHSHGLTSHNGTHDKNQHPHQIQHWEHRHIDSHRHETEIVYSQQHCGQTEFQCEHQKHFHSYQEEPSEQIQSHHEQLPDQNHSHQEYLYSTHLQQDYPQPQFGNEHSIYTQHCDNTDHSPNHSNSTFQQNHEQKHDNTFQNLSHKHAQNSYQDFFNNHSQTQNNYSQHQEPHCTSNGKTQNEIEQINKITDYQPNYVESHKSAYAKQREVEVHHVLVEHDRKNNRRHRKTKSIDAPISNENINGGPSDSESEIDDVMPRHPYDGFYLRHRVTVDCRGRKICSHEIPPIRSSSSSESNEAHDYFSAEETLISDFEEQSGVAGNLARVALGSSQREAIDDLTRRQGWEAGNIDYMGVDSFDNIWAKISQTLSQARPSPPKQSPPRETLPPTAPEVVDVQTGEIAQEPVTEPVEIAKEVIPVEEPVAVLEPDVATPVTSSETAVPIQTSVQIEPAIQIETIAASEAAPPLETSTPIIEAEVTPEVPAPATISAVEDILSKVQSQAVKVPSEAIPLSTAEPIAEPVIIATEPSTKVEIPVVAESPASVEKVAVVEQPPIPEAPTPIEAPITVKKDFTSEATSVAPVAVAPLAVTKVLASEIPVSVKAIAPVKVPSAVTVSPAKPAPQEVKEKTEAPVTKTVPIEPVAETPKFEKPAQPAPVVVAEPPACPIKSTPEKPSVASDSASDSPPLANTPSKEEIPDVSAAKSTERRKPAGKLQLRPPVALDALPTPDSEFEDAAALAQSIIASELRTPTVTSPGSASSPTSPPAPLQHSRLSVDEPEVPTPPVSAVSLSQIGVKTKGKTSTAAQIESSVSEKPEPATPKSPTEPTTQKTETASPTEVPKKKVIKKVVKKVSAAGATGGDTPVPPPRKKEKKPKE